MPFDGNTSNVVINRARLIYELRNLPGDRVPWDFAFSKSCAFCDMRRLGFRYGKEIGLSLSDFHAIFGVVSTQHYGNLPTQKITPEMVADALERAAYAA